MSNIINLSFLPGARVRVREGAESVSRKFFGKAGIVREVRILEDEVEYVVETDLGNVTQILIAEELEEVQS